MNYDEDYNTNEKDIDTVKSTREDAFKQWIVTNKNLCFALFVFMILVNK